MNTHTETGKPYAIGIEIKVYDRDDTVLDSAMLRASSSTLRRWRPEEGDLDTCLNLARDAIEQEIGTQRQEAEDNVTQLLMERMGNPRGGASHGAPPPAMPPKICHAGFFQEEVDDAIRGFERALLSGCQEFTEDGDHRAGSPFALGWERAVLNTVDPEIKPEKGSLRYEIYQGLRGYVEALKGAVAATLYDTPLSQATNEKTSFHRGFNAARIAATTTGQVMRLWAIRNVKLFSGLEKVPPSVRRRVFGRDPLIGEMEQ